MELTCAYATMKFQCAVYFIFIYAIVHNDATDYFTITINDMKLTSKPNKVNDIDIYDYYFIYGENLTITCEKKDKDILADIEMGIGFNSPIRRGSYITTKDIEKTQSIYKFFVETTYLDQAYIEFSLVNSDSNQYLRAMINFYEGSYGDRILLAVDGKRLLFELKDTPEYEGITEYVCNEGEIVDLTCSKYFNYGRLKLRYYDQNGTKMAESDEVRAEDLLNFRLLVKAENDRSYVDCIYVIGGSHNQREFTYRVIFISRDQSPKNNVFIITINGMELISSCYQHLYEDGENGTIYTYHYKFIYSDTLNITCENNDKIIDSDIGATLTLSPQVANSFTGAYSTDFIQKLSLYNQNGISYLVNTTNLDRAILKFRLTNEKEYYGANIKFNMDDHGGPAILGLSQSNIIYQYNKSATEWFIHYQYVVDEVLRLKCVIKENSVLQWIYGENIVLTGISNITYDFYIDSETNKTITCENTNIGEETRRITIVLHMITDLPSSKNKNVSKVNSETDIPEIISGKSKRKLKTLEIVGIIFGSLLAVMGTYCCWRLRKCTQVTQEKQLSRSAGEDYNGVNEPTDQTESPAYECIEYNDNTHPEALYANQESSTPIRAPAPPLCSVLPSKNTRFQIPPRGCISHREMEQCRCSTNQGSGLECSHIENEYDYVYGVTKKCPCVAPSNRGARKPLQWNGGAVVPHQVPAHQ